MKKLLLKATYITITSMGWASCYSHLLAEDNFILQPSIQPARKASQAANETASSPVNSAPVAAAVSAAAVQPQHLVLQPAKTVAPIQQPSNQQPSNSTPAETHSTLAVQLAPESSIPLQSVQPQPDTAPTADGLAWVKRGSLSAAATPLARQPVASQATRVITTVETSTSAIAKRAPTPTLVESEISSVRPQSSPGTIPASTVQWQESAESTTSSAHASKNKTRAQLASRISKKILEQDLPQHQLSAAGSSLMGPAAVEQELTEAIARSEQLCRRGVFLSAREEAKSAQLRLARYLDSLANAYFSEPRLLAAQIALREASDFSRPGAQKIVHELISAHETPALKNVDVSQAPPTVLKQSYYQFAETILLEGAQQHPWFSDIFYTLGRTYQAEADRSVGDECEHMRALAVVYYRAASTIRPTNALATNQLGYVLLQLDRPAEAMKSLIASVDVKLDAPALQNLAEASRRLGDKPMQQWALSQIAYINRMTPPAQQLGPNVIEVDNSAFSATTPTVPFSTATENRTASAPAGNLR